MSIQEYPGAGFRECAVLKAVRELVEELPSTGIADPVKRFQYVSRLLIAKHSGDEFRAAAALIEAVIKPAPVKCGECGKDK